MSYLTLANVFIGLCAALHFYFMILEMFFWTKPFGLKAFGQSLEKAKTSQVLAANQGLYNGLLASGFVWSLFHPNPEFALQLKIFFSLFALIAGSYGAWTAGFKLFLFQGLPALIALILLLLV